MRILITAALVAVSGVTADAAGMRPVARATDPATRPVIRPVASDIARTAVVQMRVAFDVSPETRPEHLRLPVLFPRVTVEPMIPFVPSVVRRWDGWAERARLAILRATRPKARPEVLVSQTAVARAKRPFDRPAHVTQVALSLQAERARGSICGNPALQGETLGNLPGPGACGIEGAVQVRSVAGVTLSSPARIDCRTALAFLAWVEASARPQFADLGGGLARVDLMGSFSCRTRNNRPGARLSEHSFGRALDIGGFRMRDGTRVTVLNGWNSQYGQRLRSLHRAACGPFGTVLGPNANAAHRDHFHFDTARYRSGSYCR